jgi:hypothetical protein
MPSAYSPLAGNFFERDHFGAGVVQNRGQGVVPQYQRAEFFGAALI